jgi:hypothetical protein
MDEAERGEGFHEWAEQPTIRPTITSPPPPYPLFSASAPSSPSRELPAQEDGVVRVMLRRNSTSSFYSGDIVAIVKSESNCSRIFHLDEHI